MDVNEMKSQDDATGPLQYAIPEVAIPALFEQRVSMHPDALAVVFGEQRLTYDEINARANQLAHHLLALSVRPEDRIAVALHRGIELPVAMLAIFKAGAVYLPIDPNYPAERIAFMLDDARPALLLSTEQAARSLALPPSGPPCIAIDRLALEAMPRHNPGLPIAPARAAYLIYTSGSTGRPKGVIVPHRGLPHLVSTHMRRCQLGPGCRVLQFASPSFDAALSELLRPLLCGATSVMAPSDELVPGAPLAALIDQARITHVTLPPAVLAVMPEGSLAGVRYLIVAGGAVSPALVERWHTGRHLINAYGPTEATVLASMTAPMAGPHELSIGTPIDNSQIHLLDAQLKPVPIGAPGEICIGGAGVARGYLNRPDLTAERFVADPFGSPGARLYRSGDLGRWRHDGTLEFLGRIDEQVKIRGFRIEPGEVQAVLEQHPRIAQATVIAREDQPGNRQLVAYAVPLDNADDAQLDPASLRRYLAERLPDYMVPAAFVMLDALPLSPNGKIDRRALPAPTFASSHAARAPLTPNEHRLAALFAETLGLDAVGIDDSFFDLGGHSLLATRLVGRIRAALNTDLPVRALFEAPTVSTLARRLDVRESCSDLDAVLPLRTSGNKRPLFCLHTAAGLGWLYAGLIAHIDRNVPVYALQSPLLNEDAKLEADITAAVDRYIEAMRGIQPSGPYRLLGWSVGGVIAHRIATRLQHLGEPLELLVLLDSSPLSRTHDTLPDDAQLLRRFIDIVGGQIDNVSIETASPFEVLSGMHARQDRFATLPPPRLHRMFEVFKHLLLMWRDPGLERLKSRTVFFEATLGKNRPAPLYTQWTPHVAGAMTVHEIPCTHDDMARPEHLAQVGRLLTDML